MLTVDDLAARLGLSVPQTRRLLRSVHTVVQHGVSRGRGNQIRISTDVVGVLDRARSLWLDGSLTLDELPDALNAEMNSDDGLSDGVSEPSSGDELPSGWQKYVAQLERENQWLRQRVETLEPLALPAPRRSLWSRLFGRA